MITKLEQAKGRLPHSPPKLLFKANVSQTEDDKITLQLVAVEDILKETMMMPSRPTFGPKMLINNIRQCFVLGKHYHHPVAF